MEIKFEDLVKLMKKSNQSDADDKNVYIRFSSALTMVVDSEILDCLDGSQLVLDRNKDGLIVGIEIV